MLLIWTIGQWGEGDARIGERSERAGDRAAGEIRPL